MWKFGTPAKHGQYLLTVYHPGEPGTLCFGIWEDDWFFEDGDGVLISKKEAESQGRVVAEIVAYMELPEPAKVLRIEPGPNVSGWDPKVFRMYYQASDTEPTLPIDSDTYIQKIKPGLYEMKVESNSFARVLFSSTEDLFWSIIHGIEHDAPGKGVKVCLKEPGSTEQWC